MNTKQGILLGGLALALAGCGGVQTQNDTASILDRSDELSQREVIDIVMACERTEHNYAIYRDRSDAEAFASIFAEDGEWGRSNGRVIKGREAIAQYVTDSVANQTEPEYHMQNTTTVKITPVDKTSATGISYALLLEAPVPEDGGRAQVAAGFQVVSESRSTYDITDDGCKIATREYTTFFVDPE